MADCRLVTMLVGARGRVGLVTPTPNGHLPALFGGPFHVQLGEWVFVRWIGPLEWIRDFLSATGAVGVNPRFPNRHGMRFLVVLVPQHQTAVYENVQRATKEVVVSHPQGT
jgi:hypothetical protein